MSLRGAWQVVGSWVFILLYGTAASAVTLVTLGAFWRGLSPWILRVWGRTMLWIAGLTWEVQGAEHLAAPGGKIVTFNHGSILDAFLVTAVMPRKSCAALKREALYYPVVGLAVWLLRFLLIDRGNSARALRTMARAAQRINDHQLAVFIAPEGTRHLDGALLPFKKGALHLALSSRAPVVPMLIDGAYDLHGTGRLVSTPGHIVIRFLPPRPSTGLTAENIGAETDALREAYRVELAKLRAERIAQGTWPPK